MNISPILSLNYTFGKENNKKGVDFSTPSESLKSLNQIYIKISLILDQFVLPAGVIPRDFVDCVEVVLLVSTGALFLVSSAKIEVVPRTINAEKSRT